MTYMTCMYKGDMTAYSLVCVHTLTKAWCRNVGQINYLQVSVRSSALFSLACTSDGVRLLKCFIKELI